jgi:hypothetical protein
MDVTSPFSQMAMEEEEPLLAFVFIGLFLALVLILPAAVGAMGRGCVDLGRHLQVYLAERFHGGSDSHWSPRGLTCPGGDRWGPFS